MAEKRSVMKAHGDAAKGCPECADKGKPDGCPECKKAADHGAGMKGMRRSVLGSKASAAC